MTISTTVRPHGYSRYKLDKCRCYTCGWAASRYWMGRKRAVAEGTWNPFVDAEPVRAHARALMAAGIGRRRIAKLAGVSVDAVRKLIQGAGGGRPPSRKVRPAFAAKILALEVDLLALAAGALMPSAGTQRRIQALACMGWSLTGQARRIGWNTGNYAALLRRPQVVRSTADKVSCLYEQLSMVQAPSGYAASRIKNMAARSCWFPPLAWDDEQIDDPATAPVLLPPIEGSDPAANEWAIQRTMNGHPAGLDMPTRDELIRRLIASGWTGTRIAAMTGLTTQRVSQIVLKPIGATPRWTLICGGRTTSS